MPEGDTIFRSAQALGRVLTGAKVVGFETRLALLASENDDRPIAGRTVERVESRGKWLLIYFSGDLVLATHMLMSGSWHLYRPGERWQMPRSAMRIVLRTADWEAVAFRVPIARFYTVHSLARSRHISQLGPDVLSDHYTKDVGADALRVYGEAHPEEEVAVVLLNQQVLAGVGNIYKSEIAFAAGVHPFRAMRTLTDRESARLAEFAQRYMQANVSGDSSEEIVADTGTRRTIRRADAGERMWVYRRQGQPCRRCGATILMRRQGAQARSTYWCPECQPWVE